jgi:lipid II:glycine glycyltransferase (peptidoglycan interpeptide bridge formation enzyme)
VQELFEIAKKEKSVFARISPPVKDFSFSLISRFKRFSSKREVFPSHTLLLDLKKTEEEILAQMKPKGRYNIRVAQRKNIEIEESSRTDIFYTLLQETTERDGFSSHNEEYYKKFLEHFSDAHLFLAYIPAEKSESGNKEYIAGALSVGLDENTFIYYYGASSQKYKECMAPYLLQWYMITFAKEQGYTCYDFLGIAPENAPSSHRLFGVTQFKRKFGGEIKEYAKETDIVFSPFWYALYRARDFVMKVFSPLVAKR